MAKKKNAVRDLRAAWLSEDDPTKRAELHKAMQDASRGKTLAERMGLQAPKRKALQLRTKKKTRAVRHGTPATPAPAPSTND